MSTQLKYSFKKESEMFFRTFKLWGIVIAIFSFALANPLMGKFSGVVLEELSKTEINAFEQTAAVEYVRTSAAPDSETEADDGGMLDGMGLEDMVGIYSDASAMCSMSLVSFSTYSLLIAMLVIKAAAGGEQKKRAMIVPLCSGLTNKNYLVPKFVIYPTAMFVVTFLGGITSGGLCNALFKYNKTGFDMIALGSLFMAVYTTFIITVFLSLGICTSKPGLMVALVFVGQLFLQSLLEGMRLTDYNPFTLITVTGAMFTPGAEGYDLAAKAPSILTAIGLSLVICVLMFFLALGVLNAKKIDNTEETKPEF